MSTTIYLNKGDKFTINDKKSGQDIEVILSHITKDAELYLKDPTGEFGPYWRKPKGMFAPGSVIELGDVVDKSGQYGQGITIGSAPSNGQSQAAKVAAAAAKIERSKEIQERLKKFDINKRFKLMEALVDLVIRKRRPALIITGRGGTGKTKTVKDRFQLPTNSRWLKEKVYDEVLDEETEESRIKFIRGYTTARGMYIKLYHHRTGLVVFDDCDEALKDKVAANILKAALDSDEENRVISWNSQQNSRNEDIPTEFEFSGQIIFISNMRQEQIDGAVLSRCSKIDLNMTNEELLTRLSYLVKNDIMKPQVSMELRKSALKLLKKYVTVVPDMNFRTYLEVLDYYDNYNVLKEELGEDEVGNLVSKEDLAEYAILNAYAS